MKLTKNPLALVLEDGFVLVGEGGNQAAYASGEVVFNTCMTGYQEILSDPSYAGQMLAMTYPLIGNYGVTANFQESGRPWARALITRELSPDFFHWQATRSLPSWLDQWGIPIVTNCDTRRLVRHLRTTGAQRAVVAPLSRRYSPAELMLAPEIRELMEQAKTVQPLEEQDLVREVSEAFVDTHETLAESQLPANLLQWPGLRLVVVDFGVKRNILRSLRARGVDVEVVRHDITPEQLLAMRPDGVVLSNGPGDPARLRAEVALTASLIGRVPILGICLGHQLIGLAAGATTSRLRFGHHGGNHPVNDVRTGQVRMTAQNHEFQVDSQTLPENSGFIVSERNLHDGSVEGLAHEELPILSVQYHPEGAPGPQDNQRIFDDFLGLIKGRKHEVTVVGPAFQRPTTVLIIGSGPIVIGQAAEFDYAGTQACRALREEGIRTVLVNSNPATIMTDEGIADRVYIEPLTVRSLEAIIAREKPDGLLGTLGGQTALNLTVALADEGILDRHGVRVIGTPLEAIREAENRQAFKELLLRIGEPVPLSQPVTSVEEAQAFATSAGFPLVIRPAFTLGGTGGGQARTPDELSMAVDEGLQTSPIRQVLVETALLGWKEIEYEVMRDAADTCIAVCNMENIDPMGVHTGDSIVVAPSQTLSDRQYHMLRSAALRIIRALRIEGGCNVQFALDPGSDKYFVIEVNPRVSRSSALASKATGYPIARIAAKIAVGRRLDEIPNAVTGKTSAAFEPALDYCVVKIPRWPFDKFPGGDRTLGIQMKSTGEVMAIERTFGAALNKALRALELRPPSASELRQQGDLLQRPNDQRIWATLQALRDGMSAHQVSAATGYAPWFVARLAALVSVETSLRETPLDLELFTRAKRGGFTDERIAEVSGASLATIARFRETVHPAYRQVDTCAAEFEAATPYYYATYEDEDEVSLDGRRPVVVIGSGPIRIGQGIEFDYCSVHASQAAQAEGFASVLINSNPETVSTDSDASTRLYFEPLDREGVFTVLERERPVGVLVQFGGQTALNLAHDIAQAGYSIAGSSVETIDLAEDRQRCAALLRELGISRAAGGPARSPDQALDIAAHLGYPVVVRPSYVLGGRAMEVVHSRSELKHYVEHALALGTRGVIWVDKYLEGTEVDVDAICDGETVVIPGILEQVERAGVHSGDSFALYPPRSLSQATIDEIARQTVLIGQRFGIVGLLNIQFVVEKDAPHVLEVNPRASRTVPFLSKVTGVPMVQLATRLSVGRQLRELGFDRTGLLPSRPIHAVKAPIFSMAQLRMVDSVLGPEMKSTGEAMGISHDFTDALSKAFLSAVREFPAGATAFCSIGASGDEASLGMLRALHFLGFKLFATQMTAMALGAIGVPTTALNGESKGHSAGVDLIRSGAVDLVIDISGKNGRYSNGSAMLMKDGHEIRSASAERHVPCLTSVDTLGALVEVLLHRPLESDWTALSMADYVPALGERVALPAGRHPTQRGDLPALSISRNAK